MAAASRGGRCATSRFWNEPDGSFWDATLDGDQSIFYATAAATLTSPSRSSARLPGSPELRFGFAGWANPTDAITAIQRLDAASPTVPLDFLSFHMYDTDPIAMSRAVESVMTAVRATAHYPNIEVAMTEWGQGFDIEHDDDSRLDPDEAYAHSIAPALHAATVLARSAAAGLSRAHHVFFWDFFPFRIRGLYQNDLETRPQYFAFLLAGAAIGDGNRVLPVTGATDAHIVLATEDAGGRRARPPLVNLATTNEVVSVGVAGRAGSPSRVRVYADPAGSVVDGAAVAGTIAVPAQSIVLIDF